MKNHLTKTLGLQGVLGEFQGASEMEISTFEKELNLQLPEDYKYFLRNYGASLFTEDVVFSSLEPSQWAVAGYECFDVFFGLSKDIDFDVCKINRRLKDDLPANTIAIGHDSGSNLILLECPSNKVYFFDRDTAKKYLIALSFDAFLHSFRPRDAD